jgi:hypothetical protein
MISKAEYCRINPTLSCGSTKIYPYIGRIDPEGSRKLRIAGQTVGK